jgi:hypothetical protein
VSVNFIEKESSVPYGKGTMFRPLELLFTGCKKMFIFSRKINHHIQDLNRYMCKQIQMTRLNIS